MKKILIALLACLPLMSYAQNTWEAPEPDSTQSAAAVHKKKTALFETKKKKAEDPKYLAGAVPEVNGRVVFTLDRDVPGMSAEQIYNKVYQAIQQITKEPNQFPTSKIAVVNKGEHTLAARIKEWLVFQNTFLSYDRSIFNYTLIAHSTDGHIKVTMERLSYQYETDRPDTQGMEANAESWITDKEALNKKKNKLVKYSAKFRRKTIDRKDNIFGKICQALNLKY